MRALVSFGAAALLIAGLALFAARPSAEAQVTCSATDTAVTAVITDPNDTAGRQALAGDCTALLNVKATLEGGSGSLNWSESLSMKSWNGLIRDPQSISGGRVNRLLLDNERLRGTIPDLSALTSLTWLQLNRNSLTGQIPDSLSKLTNLTRIWLDRNNLTGPIPDSLSKLTNLTHVYFDRNRFGGEIPASLNKLTKLNTLYLNVQADHSTGHPGFTGTIPDLSALTALESLSLRDNSLTGNINAANLPTAQLTGLWLSQNQLTGTIPDFSNHTKLSNLYLSDNQLGGGIRADYLPTSLHRVGFGANQLTGPIPDLSSHTNLNNLDLRENRLSGGIRADYFATTELEHLRLDDNQLSGTIPNFSSHTNLKNLILSENRLSGTIRADRFPTTLETLWLDNNQLSGTIPNLSALTMLRNLHLHNNQLRGVIPTELGMLTNLTRLHLAGNPLSGGIPMELDNLTSLAHLSLCHTNLDAGATLPPALEARATLEAHPLRTGTRLRVYPCLRVEDASAIEGRPLQFRVDYSTYPLPTTAALEVVYETSDRSARSPQDYSGTAGSLTIPDWCWSVGGPRCVGTATGRLTIPARPTATDSSALIAVNTTDDRLGEADETFGLEIVSPWAWPGVPAFRYTAIHTRKTATGTIVDDDPTISLLLVYEPVHPNAYGFPYLDENWPGVGAGIIARLSKRVGHVVTVPLRVGGTAEAGDYWVSNPTSANPREIKVSDGINHGQMYFVSCDTDRDDETITVSLGDLPYPWLPGDPNSVTIRIKDTTGDCGGGASYSGTLTVDDGVRDATGLKGCNDLGEGGIDGCGRAMSGNSFTHGGKTYTIQTLLLAERLGEPDVLEMVLDREPSAALLSGTTLTVDGREFNLSQATTERLTTGRWALRWPARLNWYDGKRVALTLAPTPGSTSSSRSAPGTSSSSTRSTPSSSSSSEPATCATELTASYGGSGGETFPAAAPSTLQLSGGDLVDALVLNGQRHGGPGGTPSSSLQLGPGEYITRVEVHHGNSIDRLALTTNQGRTLGAGGDGGRPSTLDGVRVLRIGGRSSLYLDAIEITYCNLP